jgi:hypothetical protein
MATATAWGPIAIGPLARPDAATVTAAVQAVFAALPQYQLDDASRAFMDQSVGFASMIADVAPTGCNISLTASGSIDPVTSLGTVSMTLTLT